ncbi:inner centromere protein A-like [Patella vulgata]|uniref:inner centromere protein A-like n=1 Tax=Patella vulgata TaxID=6465 RepID=UPI0024A9366A|nr:inner centromere protein A-like [Patella vulgata]
MSTNNTGTKIPRKTPLNPLALGPVKSTNTTGRPTAHYAEQTTARMNKTKQSQKKDIVKSLTLRGSKDYDGTNAKDENEAIRKSLFKLEEDHLKMKAVLEGTVKDAEERLEYMKALVEKSTKHQTEEGTELCHKNKSQEEHVEKDEKKPIESSISPVTSENIEPQEPEENIEKRHTMSKHKLKAMRERLQEMNSKTQNYLDNVQMTMKELEDLEGISQRMTIEHDDDEDNDCENTEQTKENKENKEIKTTSLPASNDNNSNAFFLTDGN